MRDARQIWVKRGIWSQAGRGVAYPKGAPGNAHHPVGKAEAGNNRPAGRNDARRIELFQLAILLNSAVLATSFLSIPMRYALGDIK